jgi:hypothetical protein
VHNKKYYRIKLMCIIKNKIQRNINSVQPDIINMNNKKWMQSNKNNIQHYIINMHNTKRKEHD